MIKRDDFKNLLSGSILRCVCKSQISSFFRWKFPVIRSRDLQKQVYRNAMFYSRTLLISLDTEYKKWATMFVHICNDSSGGGLRRSLRHIRREHHNDSGVAGWENTCFPSTGIYSLGETDARSWPGKKQLALPGNISHKPRSCSEMNACSKCTHGITIRRIDHWATNLQPHHSEALAFIPPLGQIPLLRVSLYCATSQCSL